MGPTGLRVLHVLIQTERLPIGSLVPPGDAGNIMRQPEWSGIGQDKVSETDFSE